MPIAASAKSKLGIVERLEATATVALNERKKCSQKCMIGLQWTWLWRINQEMGAIHRSLVITHKSPFARSCTGVAAGGSATAARTYG